MRVLGAWRKHHTGHVAAHTCGCYSFWGPETTGTLETEACAFLSDLMKQGLSITAGGTVLAALLLQFLGLLPKAASWV